ncbi:MAG: twin-arginine translocase subunit TatC [Akkermansia sp.]
MDSEKPFLDHLDDLRAMLIRMALCLLITTAASYTFSQDLMGIIRKPVEQVWSIYEQSHLDAGVSPEAWDGAKSLAYALPGLSDQARTEILARVSPQDRILAETALLLRAARLLPEDKRADFLNHASSSPEVATMANLLETKGAILTEGSGRGALKLMGAFQPGEAFMLSLKLSFYAGIIIAFPFLLFFLLQFIVPGLLAHERNLLYKCLGLGFGLFLTGVAFAYWIVLPRVLTFFFTYSLDFGIANEWRIGYYISFATQLVFLFGLAFELPVVIMPFVKLGVLSYDLMKSTRRYAIISIFVLAAFITPTPDVVTMCLMAGPMYLLYEICILMAWREDRRRTKEEAVEIARVEEDYGLH